MVTESIRNGTDTPAGWASWFLDNTGQLRAGQSAAMDQPPIRCSYHRDLLDEVGGFPDVRTGEDTAVNEALVATPTLANEDPYVKGWMIELEPEGERCVGLALGVKQAGQQVGDLDCVILDPQGQPRAQPRAQVVEFA